jgi:two-component system NarL family sensor kinase
MVTVSFWSAVMILAAVGIWTHQSTRQLLNVFADVRQTYQVIGTLEEIFSDVRAAETSQRGYVITGDERHLEPYHAALKQIDDSIVRLREETADHVQQQQRLSALEPLIAEKMASAQKRIELRRTVGFEAARQDMLRGEGNELMDQIRRVVSQLQAEETVLLKEREDRLRLRSQMTIMIFVMGSFLSLGMLFVVFYFLNQQISARELAERALQRARDELEIRVQQRTTELAHSNQALLQEIANRQQAEQEIRQRHKELMAIGQIVSATTTDLSTANVLQRALHGAIELTSLEGGTLCLVDHEQRTLKLAAHENASPETVADLTTNAIQIGDCLCGHAAETCQPLILWDNASGSQYATREATRQEGIRFHAAFPLKARKRCIGILCIFARSSARPTPRSLELVQDMCGPIALAIENAQLYEAERDARAEVERAHEQLVQILDRVADGFIALDTNWRYTFVNRQAAQMIQRSAADLLGKVVWTEFPQAVGQPVQLAYERALAEQAPITIEQFFAPLNGWFENRIYPSPNGLSVFFRDITASKQAEVALLQSQQLLQSTMDALSAEIAILDEHGTILSVNQAWRRFSDENRIPVADYGIGMNYLKVRALTAGPHVEQLDAVAQAIRDVISRSRDDFRTEYLSTNPAGQRWFQLRITRFEKAEMLRVVAAHEDVTDIKRTQDALATLSRRLMQLQDQERRHIARELHDATGQNLGALALNLARLQKLLPQADGKAREVASENLALAEQCLREIRTLSYLLHPPMLDETGLVPALRWYVDGFTSRSGIPVDVVVLPNMERLPADVERALYRVLQEGLTNVHRHANCRRASVQLTRDRGRAVLEVKDDGTGMATDLLAVSGDAVGRLGVGIMGMRERLRQLGGQLEIQTSRHGTLLRASVPLEGSDG